MIDEIYVSISDLFQRFPPRYKNQYKAAKWREVANICKNNKLDLSDKKIKISQYEGVFNEISICQINDVEISHADYFFDYKPSDDSTTQWYLNFADPHLFVAYGTDLFAQDEIQCLEHPLLGSIKELLSSNSQSKISTLTITKGRPTPILIEDVPYMIEVRTNVLFDNELHSIYGNAFSQIESARPEILDAAIRIKDTFTASNIIAMCAPLPEYGEYSEETIRYMLACTVASFRAARERSKTDLIEIHTGRWGAGAFGGNEELALLTQIIAARLSGINRLTFHAVDPDALANALRLSPQMLAAPYAHTPSSKATSPANETSLPEIAARIKAIGYKWGLSDGN